MSRPILVSIYTRSEYRETHLGVNVGDFLDSAAFA